MYMCGAGPGNTTTRPDLEETCLTGFIPAPLPFLWQLGVGVILMSSYEQLYALFCVLCSP